LISPARGPRHFIAWKGAVAGLGGGRLNELAVAAEAVITGVMPCPREGVLEIRQRRLKDLESALERFLDEHEITPTRATLVKRLH